jgi:hypothetical protein
MARIETRAVYGNAQVRKEPVKDGMAPLYKRGCGLIVLQVDPVQKVRIVPVVRPEPFRKPEPVQPHSDILLHFERDSGAGRCQHRMSLNRSSLSFGSGLPGGQGAPVYFVQRHVDAVIGGIGIKHHHTRCQRASWSLKYPLYVASSASVLTSTIWPGMARSMIVSRSAASPCRLLPESAPRYRALHALIPQFMTSQKAASHFLFREKISPVMSPGLWGTLLFGSCFPIVIVPRPCSRCDTPQDQG